MTYFATDADIEMAELRAEGQRIAAAEAAGVCTHGSTVGYHTTIFYPEQVGLQPGQCRCRTCGTVFASDEAWFAAMREATEDC